MQSVFHREASDLKLLRELLLAVLGMGIGENNVGRIVEVIEQKDIELSIRSDRFNVQVSDCPVDRQVRPPDFDILIRLNRVAIKVRENTIAGIVITSVVNGTVTSRIGGLTRGRGATAGITGPENIPEITKCTGCAWPRCLLAIKETNAGERNRSSRCAGVFRIVISKVDRQVLRNRSAKLQSQAPDIFTA